MKIHLVAYPRHSYSGFRAGHPGWLRCSSLKYSRYSRSSRLAIRAPRSAIWSSFSVDGPLGFHPEFEGEATDQEDVAILQAVSPREPCAVDAGVAAEACGHV